MRTDDTTFQAEVFRRSQVYKQKQRTRRKQAAAGMLAVICCVGGIGIYSSTHGGFGAKNMIETDLVADNAPSVADSENALAMAGQNEMDLAAEIADGEDIAKDDASRVKAAASKPTEPLRVTVKSASYPADTQTVTISVENPNAQQVTVSEDSIYIEYIDRSFIGSAHLFAVPEGEENGSVCAYGVEANGTLSIPVRLAYYGFSPKLSAGTYRIFVSVSDLQSEPAEFTVG